MIAGEQISLKLGSEERQEEVKMPLILATFLMNNGLARKRFTELSDSRKRRLIEQVKEAKALPKQLEISMKLLESVTI